MYKKKRTNNGLDIIVSQMPSRSSVSIGIWIGVGGRFEPDNKSGISHLVEHMLFKGTTTRDTKQLKESIEGVGGSFNGFTSDEVTCYMVKVPSKYTKLGMDILSDMVMNPLMDEKELAKERFVVCEEIKMYRDQPADYAVDLLAGIMWPGNPLGRPLTGTIQKVKKMKRADLLDFKKRFYHPANMAVVAAGRVNMEHIYRYISEKFDLIKPRKKTGFDSPKIKQKRPNLKVQHRDINQTHFLMGFHALARNKKEVFAMKVLNIVLGGNMSSRLFENLRERSGLCYDISSSYKRHSDVGEFNIHSGVDTSKVIRSVDSVISELRELKETPVKKGELSRAKKYLKGQFLLSMENTSSRMLWLGDRSMVYRDIPGIKDVVKAIDDISEKDVQNASCRVFRRSSLNLAMVGRIKGREIREIEKRIENL